MEIIMKKLIALSAILLSLNSFSSTLDCFTDNDKDGLIDGDKNEFQIDLKRSSLVINGIVFGTHRECTTSDFYGAKIDCSYTSGGEPQRIVVDVNPNGWGYAQDMVTNEAETINCN